ncbi:uncharacterized protein BDR25DRAFT_327975 [Lindgomyces ingoldianus]|uniref:Uncharacterized protein n=1 Tax=Lindgomyces ingoldianus TaxID=673940 RepID=A0ACB6QIB7_9PLEO|nr:uncharacterized protein BDR25DRAFT_327975 [Lindgomyces ingoldianus]KAF2466622.1 hypothetical protein BDR25DRAFT_327975 [Lindgomyces ingoldianus]
MGGLHLIRLLQFTDGEQWIARIQLDASTQESAARLRSEIGTMDLIRERSTIPVPKVYGYELFDNNSHGTGVAFMLIECFSGNAAMDLDGGYETHRGNILPERKPDFFRAMAEIQVELATIRLPKIGTIIRRDDGSYDVGPIPILGGPFDSSADFFRAWGTLTKFPMSETDIKQRTGGGKLSDKINTTISMFPSQIKSKASQLAIYDGPFPIHHPDLYHSNVIVDNDYRILGIIDWEGACTVPWELIELPLFLSTVPRPMDAAWNYDANGEPKQAETKQRWHDRAWYVSLVEEAENLHGSVMDCQLSKILRDEKLQHLAFSLRQYQEGKLGFYSSILLLFNVNREERHSN